MSKDSIETIKLILEIITALGIIVAVIGLFISIRGTYFSTIQKCTVEFRNIVRSIQSFDETKPNDANKKIIKYDLLGLFNEQLFYAKKRYIPREMKVEWLTTMFCYLQKNKAPFLDIKDDDLNDFSRVQNFVTNIMKNGCQNLELDGFAEKLEKYCFRRKLLKKAKKTEKNPLEKNEAKK